MALGGDENDWCMIRQLLMGEMVGEHLDQWNKKLKIWGPYEFNDIYDTLDHFEIGFAPQSKWMEMPSIGLLIS